MSQKIKQPTNLEKSRICCLMCSKDTRKYKCSRCLEFSCSYECYKEHKINSLCIERTFDDTQHDILAEEAEPTQHEFKSYDTVPLERLARLKTSDSLRHKLYNPHLRNLLRKLDSDPRPWIAMQNAMQEPIFVEFADECLKIVEPENTADY